MKKKDIRRAILDVVGAVGIIGVAMLAPNALQVLKIFDSKKKRRQYSQAISRSARSLIEKGFIIRDKNGFLSLTKTGEVQLRLLDNNDYKINPPKKWDEKWRVLIFDIPEKRKKVREQIRNILTRMGMVRLQDSVWVHPYDCEDIVNLLKTDLYVGKALLYLVVESIENDWSLRKHFELE
jgi:DNA-binding transcriptional regulator PaaX